MGLFKLFNTGLLPDFGRGSELPELAMIPSEFERCCAKCHPKRHPASLDACLLDRAYLRRRGATCVEMALVAPVIFLIVFASFEFSRVLMVKQALTNSAREGCRVATLGTTQNVSTVDAEVRQYLKRCFANYSDPELVKVTVTPTNLADAPPGTEVVTEVEVRFSEVSWLFASWTRDVTIIGTATMNRE